MARVGLRGEACGNESVPLDGTHGVEHPRILDAARRDLGGNHEIPSNCEIVGRDRGCEGKKCQRDQELTTHSELVNYGKSSGNHQGHSRSNLTGSYTPNGAPVNDESTDSSKDELYPQCRRQTPEPLLSSGQRREALQQ